MFTAVNQSPYSGYDLYASIPKNIFQKDNLHEISINVKLLGYLDDTTWFAKNFEDLQQNLAIADDFYALANIKINKDKTKILTNNKAMYNNKTISLKFGEDIVDIKVVPPNDNERILGIYINTNNKFKFTINKINRMLKYTCSNLKKKRITHDHVIYIINKVLIPRIEYLCQHFIILPYICNNFNRTIRSIYKSSLLLPRSIYNTIIHNQIYPNILNIWDHQFLSQTSLLNAQANNPLTKNLIEYLILYSQSRLWTNDIFFTTKYLDSPSKKLNRIENLLCIMHNYKLEFKFSFKFNTKGGSYPLSAFLIRSNQFFNFIKSLKNKDIFFLDQIITVDGLFLKTWKEIKQTLTNKKGRTPAWYYFLKDNIILNQNNLRLTFDVPVINHQNPTVSRPKIIAQSSQITKIKNIWIAYWSSSLALYTNLEFYTDGSLVRDDNIPTMGHGWIFSSDLNANITYSGASREWASSTKAELLAIITALIVCPPSSTITIHTDSNNCINTYNKLSSPKLTARRFQNINNCTLWNTLKYIISTLQLSVSFIKVKAHSGDILNDTADILAKEGSRSTEYITFNIQHIKNQRCHLTFHDGTVIDRNIRKSIKRIINFQYFERHLKHQNIHRIKDYALNNLIDWEFSQIWFKYNSLSKPTSEQYSKHVSWRIKSSSNNLPTLDILNRNYPDLLNNHETCFLCLTEKESNDHLWNCPRVLSLITPIFLEHYNKFKTLITSESESVYALYSDAITRNIIFKWARTRPPNQIIDIPDLHCLLMNFVPISLSYPFKAAKISKNKTKKLLLKFLFDLHKDIYETIWKARASAWKEFKKTHHIMKKSFNNYQRDHNRDTNQNRRTRHRNNNLENSNGYHCPFNDSRRHLENNNLWIYLTSSNFLHNLPWISSLNEDLSQFHFNIYNNIFLLNI
ncbi:hypothetical protein RhiirC2_789305 [Rhizophagus irregularis]|uniref:RNase H type-1 domain-containing protein n=1 Tax=Rhizophagus irregularis TaxID=588596 RepID=A0A2N1MNF3_9GLOM|nr:hypothetical protein RhiirC2_789305 [Rhizophagus irregularis]